MWFIVAGGWLCKVIQCVSTVQGTSYKLRKRSWINKWAVDCLQSHLLQCVCVCIYACQSWLPWAPVTSEPIIAHSWRQLPVATEPGNLTPHTRPPHSSGSVCVCWGGGQRLVAATSNGILLLGCQPTVQVWQVWPGTLGWISQVDTIWQPLPVANSQLPWHGGAMQAAMASNMNSCWLEFNCWSVSNCIDQIREDH